jgi:hypothetical protein
MDSLDMLLKSAFSQVEPSKGFESLFWKKVAKRQRAPWFQRLFQDFEYWLPTPNFAQGVAVVLLALVIGAGSGLFFAGQDPPKAFSGFDELRGIPSVSLTGAYLRAAQERKI